MRSLSLVVHLSPAGWASRVGRLQVGQAYHSPKQTILCVDDDGAILRYEKAMLQKEGYAVLAAASAQQGLRLATMCKCDAVLLDYEMLAMNGHEVAVEIKHLQPELKIILFSGSEVPTALALVDAFVPKLEASRQLLPAIAELCGRAHDGATPRNPSRAFRMNTVTDFEQLRRGTARVST